MPRLGPRLAGPLLASVALLAAAPATAQDAAGARAFVHSLYAAYHGHGPDYLGRLAPRVFSPGLLALIRRDAASTPQGDVGVLDGDPICDCQDSGGLRNVEVTVVGAAGGQARATAHFRISSEPRTVRLDLVAVQGHWRVSDIHTSDTPSLVALLTRSLGGVHPKE